MSNKQAGKGDKPRPVKKSQYNKNYDGIDWGRPKKPKNTEPDVDIVEVPCYHYKMSKRTLIIPDIHLKWEKADKIIKHEAADAVVFLGDYFDDFGDTPADAAETADWLVNSLKQPNRIHLMGNHDIHYAVPHRAYKCSGYEQAKEFAINAIMTENDWKKLPLHTWVGSWLCTHAGFHEHFYRREFDLKEQLRSTCDNALKVAFGGGVREEILCAGYSRGGDHPFGGIIWCDSSEFRPIMGINQVFGHTPQRKPVWLYNGRPTAKSYTQNLCLDVSHCNYYGIHDDATDMVTVHWIGDIK